MKPSDGSKGAALGATLALAHFLVDGPPEDGQQAALSLLAGAAAGAYWLVNVRAGWRNGYGRPIRWGGAVLGLFLLALTAGHDGTLLTPYLTLLAGVGVGSLAGALLPLAAFRCQGRLEPKCQARRFALLLAYPSLRYHGDNPRSLISNSDPLETRLLLQQYWGIWDNDDLRAVLESLQAEDRLGQTVEVVRWAVNDYMLSKEQGWSVLDAVAKRATGIYGSWQDLANGDPLAEHLQGSLRQCLEDGTGLWKKTPWPKA